MPKGTAATSVTFISPDTAYILGTAPCSPRPCSAILRTRNRGRSWQGLPAPRESISGYAGDGLWGLRFADSEHGYAFGNGLWETDDGAATWRRVDTPQPVVLALAAVSDRELIAVMGSCRPGAENCSEHVSLERRAIGSTRWLRVFSGNGIGTAVSLAVHGRSVWALAGGRLTHSSDGGASFSAIPMPCARPDSLFRPTAIALDASHAYLLCAGQAAAGSVAKRVYVTGMNGGGWKLAGQAPRAGDPAGFTAAGGTLLVAAVSGASWIYRSTDGGAHWTTALRENDGGMGWADLGFTTVNDAVTVHGPAIRDGGGGRPGRLLLSDNRGASWQGASF